MAEFEGHLATIIVDASPLAEDVRSIVKELFLGVVEGDLAPLLVLDRVQVASRA